MLEKSATSPVLKSSGLTKKRSSCSAMQCNMLCWPEPGASGVSPMCVACALLLWRSRVCLQSCCLQWLPLPVVAGFGPLLLVGQSGAPWAWVESDQVLAVALDCRVISLCCSLKSFCWWARCSQTRPDIRPLPTAGTTVKLVWEVIFPSYQGKS